MQVLLMLQCVWDVSWLPYNWSSSTALAHRYTGSIVWKAKPSPTSIYLIQDEKCILWKKSFKYLSVTVSDIDSIYSTFDLDECRTGCDRWKNLQRKYLQLINEKSETRQSFCPTHISEMTSVHRKRYRFSLKTATAEMLIGNAHFIQETPFQ